MTKGDDVVYFVMNAMESDITISNKTNEGQNLKVGDEASVSFTNFECPIYKMTAIYNPGYPNNTYMVYDLNGESVIGVRSQYAVESPITFKIEKNGTYKLSNGLINANHLGSALDTHCNIPEDGLPPNLSAVGGGNDPHFCILPDVEIKVQSSTQDENTISFDADNGDDIITKSVKSGEALDYEPKSPTKSGYTFVGWYKDTDDIKTSYKNNQIYTENTTYKAKWAHVEMLGAQGKSVVNDKSGIRFGTKIYNDGDEIVEKGTLIIPANLLKDGESLTLDTANIAKSVAKYIYEVNKDENYDIYLGTIVNIPREQFDRKMTASSYVIYKDKSGNKYTVYSPYKNTSISVNDLIK
ncbi:MAG: InlB B-repeat-containing protein [Intestinibacter bartlettii]